MSPDLVARIAADTRELGDRLDSFGVPDPQEAAHRLVRWMQGKGWRLHLELADKPAEWVRKAPDAVREAAMSEIRAALSRKEGAR